MGPTGFKGSTGLKGNKGNRGSTGIQGPKGECVVPPKILVFPESQYVFVNKSATFYCWVQGHVSKKITWRKLGGNLHRGITAENGVLYITNAQRPHTGSYLCTVFTSYGIFRAVTILGIKGEIFCIIFTFLLFKLRLSCYVRFFFILTLLSRSQFLSSDHLSLKLSF